MVKLYDLDAYATEFDAKVVSCEAVTYNNQDVYAVILDRTLFFPEEGGQSPDKGTLDGKTVLDAQIKKDIVTHYLEQPVEAGATVHGVIDWKHRFSNMQQHSGEHIFSGIVHRDYGFNNVGFHLSDNIVTMDFDGVLSAEQVADVEYKVNEAIAKNVEITAAFPSKEELAALEYRSKIEIDGAVRIVTVDGYDVCACCAPHVKRTGEIGMLKVMSVQNYKGGVRISILCGFRALQAFRDKTEVVSSLTSLLSTSQETIVERVTQMKNTIQELKLQLGEVKQNMMFAKIYDIPADEKDVILFENDLDTQICRNVVNELVEEHQGINAVFVGNDEEGYRFILGSNVQDCKAVAVNLRDAFNAKCGGSATMIQGSVETTREKLEFFFEPHDE
ncbi:MAG: alanyl-tRNA editing protein [Lachnospiraceae bacterium]|nr:alanyl-tRNA editing protein [Lachnospiraceae bacterium]